MPAVFLLYGVYLTHSRGAIVALFIVLLVGLKNRLGTVRSWLVALLALALIIGLGFSGGRSMSDQSSAERLEAWGAGLQFFKSAPIFGIGYGNFDDRFEITAHNSFVLCIAELGFVGYFFWLGLLVFTFSDLNSMLSPLRAAHPDTAPAGPEDGFRPTDSSPGSTCQMDADPEVKRWAVVIRSSLIGVLAAAWFLSRTYIMTLYVILGMAVAIYRIGGFSAIGDRGWRPQIAFRTVGYAIASVAVLYVVVRFRTIL